MNKRLIFCHGDKGGSGKSTLAGIILEGALRAGLTPYLVEGDVGIPDVAQRYRSHVQGVQIPLQRAEAAEKAIVTLFNQLQPLLQASENTVDCVVINLPGGASATVDSQAVELIAPTAEALGLDIVTVYAIGPGKETIAAIRSSLEEGLCSISQIRIAVINEYLVGGHGEPHDWINDPIHPQWLEAPGREFRLPVLLPPVRDKARNLEGTLYQLVSGEAPGLTLIERSVVSRWLHHTQIIAAHSLGLTDALAQVA